MSDGLLDALQRGCAQVRIGDVCLQGDELTERVGGVARAVAGASRVGLVARPSVETLVQAAGIILAGAAAVPISASASVAEWEHIVSDSGLDFVLKSQDHGRAPPPESPPPDEAAAVILYTSGSTGRPKGVVLPRRAIVRNLEALRQVWQWSHHDVLAHALPFHHVHGLVFGGLGALHIGSRLVHTGSHLRSVDDATVYFGVPQSWASLEDAELRNLRRARLLVSGAGMLPEALYARVEAIAAQKILNRYAMTETLVITSPAVTEARARRSVGTPLPGVQVEIVDQDGTGVGRVEVRGEGLFLGYLGQLASIRQDGWFDTGDLGRWDESGRLELFGRRDTDLIKTGGFRVGAGEVEDALLSFRGIAEAAVVGVPDAVLGQRIAAWIVCSGELSHSDLRRHLEARLSAYKRPVDYYAVRSLPRNALGKVQKHRLTTQRDLAEHVDHERTSELMSATRTL